MPAESRDFDPYQLTPHPLLIVISGPSGVGKDATLTRMKELNYPFHFVITATTRSQRPGEVHGRDYYFASVEEFNTMIELGELLEYALVYGECKGIPKAQVRQALASGSDVILRIDVQGAATIRKLVPDAILIFLVASSEEELENRLRSRKTESTESLERRIATAQREMAQLIKFDYVVVNRDHHLDDTVRQIAAIITAEKCRVMQRCIAL
jgi:guanylate kinase